MAAFAFLIITNVQLYILSHSAPITELTYRCNKSHSCDSRIFHEIETNPIHIHCDHYHACNNISFTTQTHSQHTCDIHCNAPMSCINMNHLQHKCRCYGHCIQTMFTNRRLLEDINEDSVLTNLPDYVYISIIVGLVLICGILLIIMYCKFRSERIINEHISARAQHDDYAEEETRSLSGKIEPQLITNETNYKQTHLNIVGGKYDAMILSPKQSVPISPFTGTTFSARTPSPQPYNHHSLPQSPYNKQLQADTQITQAAPAAAALTHQSTHSKSEIVSAQSQFSSQQSSQPHAGIQIIMQPVSSPNTTPQSHTIEISGAGGHKQILHRDHKRRRGYNQDSLSMSSISIPYNNRKESITITTSNKYYTNPLKEEQLQPDAYDDEDIMVHKRNNVHMHVLNIPDAAAHSHEKSHSNMSLSIASIPLDRISVMEPMEPQQSLHSDDELGDDYLHRVLEEEPQHEIEENIHEIDVNAVDLEAEIDKDELRKVFKLDEDEEESLNAIVSDHEDEFDKKKKKKRKKHKKKKKKKKKRKKKKSAVKKKEIEYEPEFDVYLEGTASNHHPPKHVMALLPQELTKQVAMDKVDENKKSLDVQSTVSSHPAFDAKNLKHFLEFVDEQQEIEENQAEHDGVHKKIPKMTNDGTFTGRELEYKEDDSESMSSGTSKSSDDISYSTSNEHEYLRSDDMSLASADPYPINKVSHSSMPHNVGFIVSIKEDQILETNDDIHEKDDNQTKPPNMLDLARQKNEEIIKYFHDDIYENKSENNLKRNYRTQIYGLVISFMGRHHRWLNCQFVCKLWHQLVHNEYWIFTPHMTMHQAHALKPGDKIDHRDAAGRFIKSTILNRKGTQLKVHYDGWSSKWDSWCDYQLHLHKFAVVRSISRCPRVRGKYVEEKMFVDIKPSYRHGKNCNWRNGKIRRFDDDSGQIEVLYKYKQKKYLLWVHLDNKYEVDRVGKHTQFIHNTVKYNRCSNRSLATTVAVHEQ